jgi:ubiquinone/menaquinone biosynthesis C-methylase UbiE
MRVDAEEHFAAMAAVWDRQAEAMDTAMGRHGTAARSALAARAGQRVVDIGCGPGMSAVALGTEVGSQGWVSAVDVVAQMADAAGRRMAAAGVAGEAVTADAGTADLTALAGHGRPFDAAHSRFGLMFFPDPHAALANIARALAPGARLAASVWQHIDRNPWMTVPTAAATRILGIDPPAPAEPGAPGPFSMADPQATERLFARAGFTDVAIESVESPFLFDGNGLDAVERVLTAGPLGGPMLAADEARRRAAVEGVVTALEPYRERSGLEVPAASWCITARR